MKFTREYFHSEVLKLREQFGLVDFWKDPENAERARKAICYVYLRVKDKEDFDQTLFESTIDELARREFLVKFCL